MREKISYKARSLWTGPAGPSVVGPQGEKGDKGDKGDVGAQGPAGVPASLAQTLGTSTTAVISQAGVTKEVNKLDTRTQPLQKISTYAYADGAAGCAVSDILLSVVGDFIEFEVRPLSEVNLNTAVDGNGYAFSGAENTAIGIIASGALAGNSANDITIRDTAGNWVISANNSTTGQGLKLFSKTAFTKVRVTIAASGVDVYIGGLLKTSAAWPTGSTKQIRISKFFNAFPSWSPGWKGAVRNIRTQINGVDSGVMEHITLLPGASATNVKIDADTFLSSAEASALAASSTTSNMVRPLSVVELRCGEGVKATATLPKPYNVTAIGDYIEVRAANPFNGGDAANIRMLYGNLCNAGLYLNSFYFRSNSQQGTDYRIWALPAGFDASIMHTYRLAIVSDTVAGSAWELFIDGISLGTKPISINANVTELVGITSVSAGKFYQYNFESLKIGSSLDGSLSWDAAAIHAAGVNTALKLSMTNDKIAATDTAISKNAINIDKALNVFRGDGFYSSFGRKFLSDGLRSSCTFDKAYILGNVGDYIEIEARYWGNYSGFHDKLCLATGQNSNSRFGWYSSNEIWFRVSTDAYKKWTVSGISPQGWHVIRLQLVATGWELFIDGASQGVKPNDVPVGENANFTQIATVYLKDGAAVEYPQRYDVKRVKIVSTTSGTTEIKSLALYDGSLNVDIVPIESTNPGGVGTVNPMCFLSYDATTKVFDVYLRDASKQDTYYGFKVALYSSRGTENDQILYAHFWELVTPGYIYTYASGTMVSTGVLTIAGGESEMTMMYTDPNGEKADHTGGVHGDETIDVTPGDFCNFYVNGVKLTTTDLSASFNLLPCNEFEYLQKSSLHETAYKRLNVDTGIAATGPGTLSFSAQKTFVIDGVDTLLPAYAQNQYYSSVASAQADGITLSKSGTNTWVISLVRTIYPTHPVVATHIKRTTFSKQGYTTQNTLVFASNRTVNWWYAGICCLGKGVATWGCNEDAVEVDFTNSGAQKLSVRALREFHAYNPATLASGYVTSRITETGGGAISDEAAKIFVWDRADDSKYYRQIENFTPQVGKRMTSVMEVVIGKK